VNTWRIGVVVALASGCGGTPDAPPLPAWDKTLPEARVMGSWRGLQPARGIVHLHSPYSHDACDNHPRDASGVPNEACLADLRSALCTTRIDFAALTDHDASMADEEFPTLFNMRGTDVAVRNAANEQIASKILCDDGHEVQLTVGGENELMPVMLDRHVPGTVQQRHDTYNAADAAAVAAFHEAGGLAWVAHTESKTLELLRATVPDGLEVYNLHANIDPKIRPLLGLDPSAAIAAAAEFADTNPGHPEPDLAFISFVSPNQPAITTWNTLLGEGRHLPATAGSDAHENAIPITFADGERGDSYRRVLRWFGNIVMVADPTDPVQIEAALKAGRLFTVFEVLGTPEGLDIRATGPTRTYELGDVIPSSDGAMLSVSVPHVRNLDPALPVPVVHARVLWIETPTGVVTELASTDRDHLDVHIGAPGAYRVEISITPRHLGPYLGDLGPDLAEAELPWIYASPIYVQ
jgi:hypothetical protein